MTTEVQPKFSKTEMLVERALRENPITRTDDFLLILEVYRMLSYRVDTETFAKIAIHHKALKLPMPATITRCRQVVQNFYPELKDVETSIYRENVEQDNYKNYARNRN